MLAAIYTRESTWKQVENDLTSPGQLQEMRQWCVAQGHQVVVEYVEPKLTVTNDRRSEFRKMIAEATTTRPYDLIVVHTLNQFCRDAFEFGLYKQKLLMAGVSLISITQNIGSAPSGNMMRHIISVFDEYQSRAHGKLILRAMKANASQGFFNGSKPPFGYKVVEADVVGRHGQKKHLEVDPAESSIVKRIFARYVDDRNHHQLDAKQIAEALNAEGLTYRGVRWNRARVYKVLANKAYIGEYFFNTRDHKTKQVKPESEWVRVHLPAIVEQETFKVAAGKCSSLAPDRVAQPIPGLPYLPTGVPN